MGFGFWVWGLGFWVWGFEDFGFWVPGFGFRVPGLRFWVLGFGFWVQSFGLTVPSQESVLRSARESPVGEFRVQGFDGIGCGSVWVREDERCTHPAEIERMSLLFLVVKPSTLPRGAAI